MSRWLQALVLVALLLVGAGGLLIWNPAHTEQDVVQERLDRASAPLLPDQTIGQTFYSRHSGLKSITILLVIYDSGAERPTTARLTLTLERLDPPDQPPILVEVDASRLEHNQRLTFDFQPLVDSAGAHYRFTLRSNGAYGLGSWHTSTDAYAEGTMLVDGQARSGDLYFVTDYDYHLSDALQDLARQTAALAPLLPALFLLLGLPGFVLALFAQPLEGVDGPSYVAVIVALSIVFWPLFLLWASVPGLSLAGGGVWLVILGLLAAGLWRAWVRRRLPLFRSPVAGREAGGGTSCAASLALAVVLALTAATRALQVRELIVPAWVDSVHHTVITRLISDLGRIPSSYEPYLAVSDMHYHYGFHANAAALGWLCGLPSHQAVLLLGQVLNALTPLGTAYSDSSPVLCIASQIPSSGIGRDKGYLHECLDQLGCFRAVTTWCARADSGRAIPALISEAFVRMQSGRPQPAAIEIPCDVLDARVDVTIPEPAAPLRRQPDPGEIDQAAELLGRSQRAVIWAGGGAIASGASAELRELAERLQAPVFTTTVGKGAMDEEHPLFAGSVIQHPTAREFVAGHDVLLAVGARLTQDATQGGKLPLPTELIHIEINPEEVDRNYRASVAVVGDAREALRALNARLEAAPPRAGIDRSGEVAELKRQVLQERCNLAPEGVKLVQALRAALPRDTIIVNDVATAAYWCRYLLEVYEPRTYLYPSGFCTLGFGLPAAIGAKLAQPDRPVALLSGDGGFMFNCQELAVIAQCDVPIVALVFNNNAYGILRPQQMGRYGRTIAVDLVNPDFVALSRAFGIDGRRVTSLDELGPAVAGAIGSNRPTVIDVAFPVPLPW